MSDAAQRSSPDRSDLRRDDATDSSAYRMLNCPFCDSEIRHVESWAKSFDPPRLYHEWHHDDTPCQIHYPQGGTMVANATDDPEMQARVIRRWNTRATTAAAQPVAWQYRVMFDKGHRLENDWCDWRDAGKKYYDKVCADIAAGATRVQARALYATPSPLPAPDERTMVAEIAFDPTNHHNALKCPYCNPKGLTFAAPGEVAGGGERVVLNTSAT